MAEVTNPETLLVALRLKVQRAATELDDATAAQARAEGERAATETILASMELKKFRADHIAMVAALLDPEALAIKSAQDRKTAAATALAAAQKAVNMAALHVQLQDQGAAGSWYQNGQTAAA